MSFLKTFSKRADEPYRPDPVVEEEPAPVVSADPAAPSVSSSPMSFDLSEIAEDAAEPIKLPDSTIKLDTADLAANLEALDSRKLAISAAQQGALEPVAALREAARLKVAGADVDEVDRSQVFDYMRGREVKDTYTTPEGQVRSVTDIFTQPVIDLPAPQMQQLTKEGRQVKKIRTFEDISVDVLSNALKDQYIKNAAGDKAAGSAKYKGDLQSLADSGVLPARADGQPLTLRDVESILTAEYGRRMAGPKAVAGVNLLLSVTEDAGNESLNLVESTLSRRAAAATGFGAGLLSQLPSTFDETVDTTRTFEPIEGVGDFFASIFSVAAPDQLLEDSPGRALRLEKEVADNIAGNVILDAVERNRLGSDPKFSDFKSFEDPKVKALAELPAEEQNLAALASRIGIRADVLAGTSQAESGNNPTALAFNLDEAREFMTPEQVAELDQRLSNNLGYVRPPKGTDEPIFGREKVNQYINEVAAVSPQAAVRATAFGQFQVLGETGKFLDLAREEYAKQFPDEPALDDDQAATVALEMFKSQPRAVSFALAERWWAQRPTLKEKVNAGDFSTLTKAYTGTSDNPDWDDRFKRGANRMAALVGQMVPDEEPPEALVSTGPTLFKSGVDLDRSLEAQREQQVREEEESGGFIGVNNRLLASTLGSPETEEEFERETGIKATKVEGETFDIDTLVNKDFMPTAGTARYEVSVRTWESILKNSPDEAKRLQNIGMTALGQSFDKVRREVEQRYESALDKRGFEGMSSEEINRRISLESLDIITSMQVAGVWHTPVYVSFDQLMGKTDPEGFFDALAPRIEVLGRSGDEIIYRSETGAMQIFSAIDSLPIIGQAYNLGVVENYLFPMMGARVDQIKALYDDPSWQNLSALGKDSTKMALSLTGPGIIANLVSGEFKEIHEAGVRGVTSRSNFAEFTMDLTADIASYAVETDIGKEAIEAAVGREDVVKTQDQIRLAGRFAGLPSGLFLAVVHPDALVGVVSALKGAKAASRTLLALPDLEKGLSPAIIGGTRLKKLIPTEGLNGRQILYASGDQRKAMTVALAEDFEQLSTLADNPENVNVDNIKALFARIEGMESVLGDLDTADANRRAASPMLMDELDRITDELLSAARESGDASAAVLVDIPRAKRIGAIVDQVIASGLKNPATKEKAEELSKLVRRGEPGQALADVLTLERSAARRAVKGDVIASEVFSTGDRLKALRLTVELFDDIGANNFNIRRSVFAKNIEDVSRLENFEVESLNIKLPEGVSEVTPLSAIEVFGAVTENALRTDPKFIAIKDSARQTKILESRQQLEDFVVRIKKAATSTKYEESLLNPDVVDALRLDLINSKLTDVSIDKGGSYTSMIYRNHADGGRSASRFNAAVNGLTDQAGVVSGSSTLQQDLYFGMAGILSYNLHRGEATAETARRLVDERALGVAADALPDDVLAAKDAFLQKSPASTRGTRLVNAALSGTREGLLNLIGSTPFMGKDLLRLANVSEENILRLTGTGSKAAMRARSSQMTMDGSDPYAVSAAVQSEVVKRLKARRAAILSGIDEDLVPAVTPAKTPAPAATAAEVTPVDLPPPGAKPAGVKPTASYGADTDPDVLRRRIAEDAARRQQVAPPPEAPDEELTPRAPQAVVDIDAEIARVSTDEWRVSLVNWMRESAKRNNAGEELPPDFDLPVGIDLKAFTSGTLKYKPSAATKNFVETSGFLKAYGFAGEQTQNNLRLGKLRRTRPKKLSKKEETAVITILDQMVRFMAKVNFDDSAEVVNAKMANWYEAHIKGVRRTVNNATYQKRLKSLEADFYSKLNAQVESLLGKSLGDFIAEKVADPANLKVPDAFDSTLGAANDLKRGGIAVRFNDDGVRADDVVYEIYDIAEDGTISLRPFGDRDVEKLVKDVDRQTTRVLTGDARQQLDDAIFRAQTVALDSLLPVMSDEEAFEIFGAGVDAIRQQIELRMAGVDPTMRTAQFLNQGSYRRAFEDVLAGSEPSGEISGLRVVGGDPEDFDIALSAGEVDDVEALFSDVGINFGVARPYEAFYDESDEIVAASTVGRRDTGELSFDIAVRPDYRRRGLARRLVERIVYAHPGEEVRAWVVNENMAALLDSMGFASDGAKWSQDSPYMSVSLPTRNVARQSVEDARRFRETATQRAAEAAERQADETNKFVLQYAASALKANRLPASEQTAISLKFLDPRRLVEDPEFTEEIYRRIQAGEIELRRRQMRMYLPVDASGQIDDAAFSRRVQYHEDTLSKADSLMESGAPRADALFQQDASAAGARSADEVAEARRLWEEQGVESPYFKRWFGDSKVVAMSRGDAAIVEESAPKTQAAAERAYDAAIDSIIRIEERAGLGSKEAAIASPAFRYENGRYVVDESTRPTLRNRKTLVEMVDNIEKAEKSAPPRGYLIQFDKVRKQLSRLPPESDLVLTSTKPAVDLSPAVMYHGSPQGRIITAFDGTKFDEEGLFGPGVYLTSDENVARGYAGLERADGGLVGRQATKDSAVLPVYVRVENPLDLRTLSSADIQRLKEQAKPILRNMGSLGEPSGMPPDAGRFMTFGDPGEDFYSFLASNAPSKIGESGKNLKKQFANDVLAVMGFDGIIHTGGSRFGATDRPHKVVIAFDPKQVKSVENIGTFDPQDARILFQQDEVADVVDPEQAKRARQAIDKAQSDFSKQAKAPELAPDTEEAVLAKVSKTDKSYEELSETYETKTTKQLVNEVGKRGLKPSLEFTGRPVDLTDEAFERTRLIDALVSDDLTPKDVKVQKIRAAAIANLDYDAMKVEDLQAEIRKRNADLKKVDKLRLTAPRSVLIEQLRKNDNAAAVARGDVPAGEQFVEAKFVGKPKFKRGLRPAPIVVNTRREVLVADPLMKESVSQFEPVSVSIFRGVPADSQAAVSEIKLPIETLKKNYIKWRQLSKGDSLDLAQASLDRIVNTKNPRAALVEAMDEERVGSADRSLLVIQGIEGELKSVDQQLASAKAAAKKDDALISRLSAQKESLKKQKALLATSEFKTNFFFTHSLDDTLKFDSPEAALADANRRLSVPDERAATFDEVLPSLSESDLAFVKRALDAAEENENFINIRSINRVAEDVPQKRVSDLYEMMKRTGLFSKRSAKPGFRQVSPDVAAKVNARIAAFFDPKARIERLEKSINLFERINELDLDMLTRPEKVSAILDEDIRDFLLELKKSDPEAYRRMIDLRRDTLSREIAEQEVEIKQIERSLDRMKRKVPTNKRRRDIRLAAIQRGEKLLAEARVNLDTIRSRLPTTPPRAEIDMARVDAISDVRRARDAAGIDGVPPPPPTKRGAVEPTPDSPGAGMPKGMVYFFNDTSAILYAFRQADISTGLHEMAHVLRRQLDEDQLRAVTRWTNSQLQKDGLPPIKLTDSSGRLDFDFPDNPESVVMAEELFARAFERYVREGETPNTLLRSAFSTMRETLKRIYSAITGNQIDVYISPEMYGLFDDIFGAQRSISLSDISDGPQMYLDMQEVLARGGQRRLTARIAEQEQVEDTFVESRRQLFASLADYRARGFLPFGFKTKGRATAGTVGSKTVDKSFQLGPISRRMLSLEEIGKAREAGEVPAAYRALDVAAVTSASIAELGSYLVFLGGDANALLRLVPPAVRTAVNGVVREYEEFSSELSMRLIDLSRMNSEQLKSGVTELIRYSRGKQVRMLTGAQRGQRARANFVDTEYHFANMIRSFYSKLSSVSKEAAAQDASRVLSGKSQKYGAINGFWRGYSVRTTPEALQGLSPDEFNDGLRLSSELDELLKETVQKNDTTLSQMQNEMLGNVFSAITGEATVTSNRIEAEKLGAELSFLSGAVPITLKNTDGEDVVFTVADLNPERSFFENMFFGTTIKKDGAQLTINGITGITEKAPGRAIGTLSIAMQAGYVAGSYDDLRRIGFGLRASDARLFAKYLSGNGAMMSMDELARAKEIFRRFGRTKFEVAPTSLGDFYVPEATRTGIVNQQNQALRQMGLQKNMGGISWHPASWMLSFYQSMIIFGSVFQRQAFKLMSTQDLALQVGLIVGGSEGAAAAARASALTLLSAVGAERIAEVAELTVDAAYKIAGKKMPPAMFKAKVREFAIRKGDELVRNVSEFMGAAKFRVEVNPIIENQDKLYVIGGRIYNARDLRKTFTQAGMYSNAFKEMRHDWWRGLPEESAETAEMSTPNKSLLDSTKSAASDFFKTRGRGAQSATRRAFSTVFEHGLESADAWSDLERTGAAVTLMEFGYNPRDAARLVVESVYDYRGSLTKGDRNWVRRLLMPFWAFRKNSNTQALNMMASPQGAFRIMALRRALEFGPEALTHVIYESLLQPYDVDISLMTPRVRDVYYETRTIMELGYGDEADEKTLAEYRAQLPEGSENISDEELLDYSFGGWTIRNGFGGYQNVPGSFRVAFRAILSGNTSSMVRERTGLFRLSAAITQKEAADFYVQEGAKMAARAARGETGLPAWAAKRPTIQVPLPVLNESAREMLSFMRNTGMTKNETPDPGDSLYFIMPDNFIMSAVDHAGGLLATMAVLYDMGKKTVGVPSVEGEEPPEVGKQDIRRLLNAVEPIVDVRDSGGPQLQLIKEMLETPELGVPSPRQKLHPIMARLIEGSMNVSLPHDGDKPLNIPGSAFFFRTAGAFGGEVFAQESLPGRFSRMRSRPVNVVARDAQGRTSADEGFDLSTAKREVDIAQPLITQFDYTVPGSAPRGKEGKERLAYTPYLYGPSAIMFPATFTGQINKWLLDNVGDNPLEVSMLQDGDFSNFVLNLLAEGYKIVGGRVQAADYGQTASMERQRK